MSEEILCILNAGTVDFSRIRGTGRPEITPALVAAALRDIKPKYYHAAIIKYTGDFSRSEYMAELLLNDIATLVTRENWEYPKGLLLKLCRSAVAELHNPRINSLGLRAKAGKIPKTTFFKYQGYYNEIFNNLNELANSAYRQMKKNIQEG